MGDVGWVAMDGSASTLFQSEGVASNPKKKEEKKCGPNHGVFTKGMSDCFTVVVAAKEGVIMAHVSAYLGDSPIDPKRAPELKVMKDAFAKLWAKHRFDDKSARVVIIKGAYTQENNKLKLMGQIFPQLAKIRPTETACKKAPYPPTKYHGTALVKIGNSGTEIFVEDQRFM
jgi:hypothetical protein